MNTEKATIKVPFLLRDKDANSKLYPVGTCVTVLERDEFYTRIETPDGQRVRICSYRLTFAN